MAQRRWLVFAVLAGLLSACGPQATPPPTGDASAPSSGPPQPKVNRVVLAVPPPTAESNEPRMLGQTTLWQLRPMYEYLIGYDPNNGRFTPELATDWALNPDGRSYSFKLRRGVQFHGGYGEYTSKDVEHTWRDLIQDGSTHAAVPYFKEVVRSIDTADPYTAVFHVDPESPLGVANLLNAISATESVLEQMSKADFEKNGPATMQSGPKAGTGPYQFKERAQGQYLRFERAAQHYQHRPDFPEFEFRFQREASTRLAALLTNEVHVASLPDDLMTQAQRQGFKAVQGRVPGLRAFFNVVCCFLKEPRNPAAGPMLGETPLQDARVRRALQKAINLDELNKAFFGGKGSPMHHTHLHPTRPGWNPEWERSFQASHGYDPEAARRLLTEAGYNSTRPVQTNLFVTNASAFSSSADMIEAVAGYWRAVGVNVQLVTVDEAERSRKARAFEYNNHLVLVATSSAELIGARTYWTSLGPRGDHMEDPELDAVMQQITREIDPQKRDGLWRRFGDASYPKQMSINLFWLPAEAVVNPSIVADWVFPGAISGTWTHVWNIKAAP